MDALKKQKQELQKKLDAETARLIQEFLAKPEIVAEKAKFDGNAKKANELRKQLDKSPEMVAIRAKRNEASKRVGEARKRVMAELEQDQIWSSGVKWFLTI